MSELESVYKKMDADALKTMMYAQEELRRLGKSTLSPEFVFLGSVRNENSTGGSALYKAGVTIEKMRISYKSAAKGHAEDPSNNGFSEHCVELLLCASKLAENADSDCITSVLLVKAIAIHANSHCKNCFLSTMFNQLRLSEVLNRYLQIEEAIQDED